MNALMAYGIASVLLGVVAFLVAHFEPVENHGVVRDHTPIPYVLDPTAEASERLLAAIYADMDADEVNEEVRAFAQIELEENGKQHFEDWWADYVTWKQAGGVVSEVER